MRNQWASDDSALGAGDPGALDALFGRAETGARQGLAEAYRRHGWRAARLDPLGLRKPERDPSLDPAFWGAAPDEAAALERAYCGSIGWEFGHVQTAERSAWLAEAAERRWTPDPAARLAALTMVAQSEAFEAATQKRLPTTKTFSLSGADGYLVLVEAAIRASGARSVVVGGMHRGRLTQMALLFGKPLVRLVAECFGAPDLPEELGASSDVPYHLGWEGTRPDGVAVWVAPHPSHLSIVAPVAMGRARASAGEALPLMLHTDAAFAGQGVNAELLQLSELPPYAVGGSLHLILNNQIGFTTDEAEARTARSAADFAKAIEAPILHVNGEDPDALMRAAEVAVAYRARFGGDIVIELIAFRRRGHNEIDEARFTQPALYRAIDAQPPLSARYAARIGAVDPDLSGFAAEIDAAFQAAKGWEPNGPERPTGLSPTIEAEMCGFVDTGVDVDRLRTLGARLTTPPGGFDLHPKVVQFLDRRRAQFEGDGAIDWATAEALAFASILADGRPVRFGGQDAVRGAFTQRHLRLTDQASGRRHLTLDGLGAPVEAFNTPLIENATLGFEYGFSTASPDALTVWEAQFGDFLNVCQPIFDQFVTGGEDRWLLQSGLTMLLPHGMDGGGPDHSTGHPERILARCARGNIQLVNASTPANYFHALRRQLARPYRKPLVVLTPKALLRHAACVSPLADFAPGTGFAPVLAEPAAGAERVVICSGKLFYLLDAARRERGLEGRVALIRLEQLYPFPEKAVAEALAGCGGDLVWAQEEPENLGPFTFLDRRLEAAAGRRLRLATRPAAPSPAVGWKRWHDREIAHVIDGALGAPAP